MKKTYLALLAVVSMTAASYCQDLRGGDIFITYLNGLTYQATVYTYQEQSTFINRPSIILDWGDGTQDTVYGGTTGTCSDPGIIASIYSASHTFPAYGDYTISYRDSFRVAGIKNIDNSSTEQVYLQSYLVINPFLGPNNSPTVTNCHEPTWGCCNWVYNSGAIDPDGDSLVYSLVPPYTSNYSFPTYSLDPITGDLYLTPDSLGKLVIALRIDEWRTNGSDTYHVGNVTREMTIDVVSLTSTNDITQQEPLISVFPIPAHDKITISIGGSSSELYTVRVCNILGQVRSFAGVTDELQIDLSNYAKGVYFVEVLDQDGKGFYVERFLIQ